MLRVLHINTGQAGGAAWCAIRINKALVKEGVDSCMLFAEGDTLPDGVSGAIAKHDKTIWNKNRVFLRFRNLLAHFSWYMDAEKLNSMLYRANKDHLCLHQPLSCFKNISHHPLVEWADIIHLHWVPNFVDYPTFFKEVNKPIVWTLHDHYPAVGVQHYISPFSKLPDNLKSIDNYCREIKRKGLSKASKIHVVAISECMINICAKSDLLRAFPVTLIHNGVDTSIFKPYDKQKCRKFLGLLPDAVIFLFSSYVITDKRKGLNSAIEALESINIPNKMLICIGNIPIGVSVTEASFPIIVTGELTNQEKIAKYYSASDFFLQCSYDESFGQTLLEAMSCGTPVISTPCGISKELILPNNGIICSGYDPEAIAVGIRKAMEVEYESSIIRHYIVENYQYDKIAKQYVKLYESIM